jgi:hypothetical protein
MDNISIAGRTERVRREIRIIARTNWPVTLRIPDMTDLHPTWQSRPNRIGKIVDKVRRLLSKETGELPSSS